MIEENGVRAVVKDFCSNGFLYRNIIGRFLVWRESKAYRRLRGIKGVPVLYRTIGGLALIIEEVAGKDIESIGKGAALPRVFFEELRALVERIHERGLAHCDLKRAPNIILGDDGKPYIVDWSTALLKWEFRFFPFNLIYRRFIQDDLNALTKIRLKHCPELVSHKEKSRYTSRSQAEKHIRIFRDKARELLQKIA
ncbi:hypothetical protein ACFL7M_00950 [Thermodesulfobacteriota bacterium]